MERGFDAVNLLNFKRNAEPSHKQKFRSCDFWTICKRLASQWYQEMHSCFHVFSGASVHRSTETVDTRSKCLEVMLGASSRFAVRLEDETLSETEEYGRMGVGSI